MIWWVTWTDADNGGCGYAYVTLYYNNNKSKMHAIPISEEKGIDAVAGMKLNDISLMEKWRNVLSSRYYLHYYATGYSLTRREKYTIFIQLIWCSFYALKK